MKNIHILVSLVSLKRNIAFITLIFILINVFLLTGCSNGQKEGEKGFAYISSQKGNVLVMSLENFEIISEIEVGLGNRGIGITEDGSKSFNIFCNISCPSKPEGPFRNFYNRDRSFR